MGTDPCTSHQPHLISVSPIFSPTCLQRVSSADKASSVSETGEVSIPVPRPQIETQILAETVQIPTGSWKPSLRSWVAASFKVDNQCLCEAKLMPTHRACAAPQSCCSAVGCRSCGSPGLVLIRDNSKSTNEHCHQCWIIRATHVFLLDYGCSEASFTNWSLTAGSLGVRDNKRSLQQVGHSYSSSLTQTWCPAGALRIQSTDRDIFTEQLTTMLKKMDTKQKMQLVRHLLLPSRQRSSHKQKAQSCFNASPMGW